jgi:hemerythrin-like metal-binding protein
MALIQWEDGFALGIPDVDHEHRALIDLINRLHAALGAAATTDEIADFLAELHASVAAHFALEESVMRQCGYDQLAAHKADHERLLDDIRDIMDDHLLEARADYEQALSERLRGWFEQHFRDADRRLHDMLPRAFAPRPSA